MTDDHRARLALLDTLLALAAFTKLWAIVTAAAWWSGGPTAGVAVATAGVVAARAVYVRLRPQARAGRQLDRAEWAVPTAV